MTTFARIVDGGRKEDSRGKKRPISCQKCFQRRSPLPSRGLPIGTEKGSWEEVHHVEFCVERLEDNHVVKFLISGGCTPLEEGGGGGGGRKRQTHGKKKTKDTSLQSL